MQKQTKSTNYQQMNNFFLTKQPKAKSNISQSVKGICTNIWYMLGGESMLTKKKSHQFQSLVILGKRYQSYEVALQRFKQILWFTYRKQLKLQGEIKTDLGWGCLIRVGQMLLANSLKKYFQNSSTPSNQENLIFGQFLSQLAFLDDSEGIRGNYSYQRIFKLGQLRFKLKTGDWFNISQICYIMMSLQNKNPMKGSQDFKMIYFNQTLIFLDEVFQSIRMPMCLCDQKKIICQLCNCQADYRKKNKQFGSKPNYSGSLQLQFEYLVIDEPLQNQQSFEGQTQQIKSLTNKKQQSKEEDAKGDQFDLLLVVSTRISYQSVDKKNFQGILDLLNLKTSMGMIGGVPGKGLYFVGACDQNLIYLDPHLVQNPVNTFNLAKELTSFHCEDMRLISRQKLDPSVAFAFYIRNLQELSELINTIEKIKKKNPEAVPISYMWENEYKDENEAKSNEYDIEDCSPDFPFVI